MSSPIVSTCLHSTRAIASARGCRGAVAGRRTDIKTTAGNSDRIVIDAEPGAAEGGNHLPGRKQTEFVTL